MKWRTLLVMAALLVAGALGSGPVRAQDWAKARLMKSPRHQEWVKLHHDNRTIDTFVVYPEVRHKATAVVLIHEIFGLSDWIRELADEVAAQGYIAIVPDLLSGTGPNGGGTSSYPDQDAVTRAVFGLPPDQVTQDLESAIAYASTLPSSNGKVAVAGFCWGGGQSFRLATDNHVVKAAFVFYGPPPDEQALSRITCPVYGFYGLNDNRISSTVPDTAKQMKNLGKTYEAEIYGGAGHGFMRAGEAPDASADNRRARTEGFRRWMRLMKGL